MLYAVTYLDHMSGGNWNIFKPHPCIGKNAMQNAIKEWQPILSSHNMLTKFASAWSLTSDWQLAHHLPTSSAYDPQGPMPSSHILPLQEMGPFHILWSMMRKPTWHNLHHGCTMGSLYGQTHRKWQTMLEMSEANVFAKGSGPVAGRNVVPSILGSSNTYVPQAPVVYICKP